MDCRQAAGWRTREPAAAAYEGADTLMKKALSLSVLLLVMAGFPAAQSGSPGGNAAIANKTLVFGGACKVCPWGALAEVVGRAMQHYGYDVQICRNCNAEDSPRIVAEARTPPP